MAATSLPCTFSASKLRRHRAAAVKQKLFESAQRYDPLLVMQTQLAMLTAAFDNLQMILLGSTFPASCYKHHAAEFVPSSVPTYEEVSDPTVAGEPPAHAATSHISPSPPYIKVEESFEDPLTISAQVPDVSDGDHSDCAQSVCQATNEDVYAPWLFLDFHELAQVSQTCSASFRLVQESTPLFSDVLQPWQDVADSEVDGNGSQIEEHTAMQTLCAEAVSDDYIVTVTLHGRIDYDSVGDYLLSFGEVDLEDQLGELHGRDVSTWRFTKVACAAAARNELVHYAPNDRGKKVKLELR